MTSRFSPGAIPGYDLILIAVFRGPKVGLGFTKTTHPKVGQRDTIAPGNRICISRGLKSESYVHS